MTVALLVLIVGLLAGGLWVSYRQHSDTTQRLTDLRDAVAVLLKQKIEQEARAKVRREMWAKLAAGSGREQLRERLMQRLEGTGMRGDT